MNPITGAIALSGIILLINAALTWDGMFADRIKIRTTKVLNPFKRVHTTRSLKRTLEMAPELIAKPLWDCIICMSPWYALLAGWIIYGSWITPKEDQFIFFGLVIWINVLVDTFVIGKREGIDG